MAAIKIVKKLPDTAEDFVEKVEVLMEDRHQYFYLFYQFISGVLLSTLSLVEILIKHNAEYKNKFKKYFTPMIRVLKGFLFKILIL